MVQHGPRISLSPNVRVALDASAIAALQGLLARGQHVDGNVALDAWKIAELMEGAEEKAFLERRALEGW